MNILITGATGFIGSYLVKELITNGHHCRCLVRDIGKAEKLFSNARDIELVVGDILNPESLTGVAEGIDAVFHLAAIGHVTAAGNDAYKKFMEVNVRGTENIIAECQKESVNRFFHFSSTAAVGLIPDSVVDENTAPQPKTPYQKSKLASENVVNRCCRDKGFPAIILRPCMVYGVNGLGEFYKFVKLVQKGLMPIVGKREKLTPLVHVKDIVAACLQSLTKARTGETYFICGPQSYPFDTILQFINAALETKGPLRYAPESLVFFLVSVLEACSIIIKQPPLATKQNLRSTIANRVFSIEKAKQEFGYHPSVDLETGINETVAWYKSKNLI